MFCTTYENETHVSHRQPAYKRSNRENSLRLLHLAYISLTITCMCSKELYFSEQRGKAIYGNTRETGYIRGNPKQVKLHSGGTVMHSFPCVTAYN